jgi:hypothetical protein
MAFVCSSPPLWDLAELRTYECTGSREVLSCEAQAVPSMWVANGRPEWMKNHSDYREAAK